MKKQACKIVAVEHLTLDGVYQGPATADEDTRNGFTAGGWSVAGSTPQLQELIGKYMAGGWSLLAGRTTYEKLYEGWEIRQPESAMAKALRQVQKFVLSHTDPELPWENTTLLSGEAAVAELKNSHDKTLVIFGSGILTRSLLKAGLVDELLLMIHPVTVGNGFRFFSQEMPLTPFKLAAEITTEKGVIVATYQYPTK